MEGALITGGSGGVNFQEDFVEINNQGAIRAIGGTAITFLNAAVNQVAIDNTGSIAGWVNGIEGTANAALDVAINNAGTITGGQYGLWLEDALGAAPVIVNSGTIKGGLASIHVQDGDRLNVTNTGKLIGNVVSTWTNAVDTLTNHGNITGNVLLGSGNDLYQGKGSVSGTVFGEAGNDSLSGGNLTDRLNGGDNNDILAGNGGNDVLNGGNGNDTISGGLGIDTLTGGANNDYFVFNTAPNSSANRDIVSDFNPVNDAFRLENAIFTTLGAPGMLNPAFFRAGVAALDGNDRVIYNQATGVLSYDGNGNAAGGMVGLAVLTNKPALTANDFVVI